ncbi:hypothetical protein Aut01nite_85040 [Actinoplanes utahensis]|nr:hypothetical protein Aut01nite_85040 [Actinoplanes utahensis]
MVTDPAGILPSPNSVTVIDNHGGTLQRRRARTAAAKRANEAAAAVREDYGGEDEPWQRPRLATEGKGRPRAVLDTTPARFFRAITPATGVGGAAEQINTGGRQR